MNTDTTMTRPVRLLLPVIHAVVFGAVLTYFVVTHVAGEGPDANIGLGLSEQLMQVLGVPWTLLFDSNNAVYLIGCAALNLALHIGWHARASRRR